jgi:Mn-dependent DtxR family transcriptional regulator
MSVSIDDFLNNIYLISRETGSFVISGQPDGLLNVSVGSVTDMARKPGKQRLLDYRSFHFLSSIVN